MGGAIHKFIWSPCLLLFRSAACWSPCGGKYIVVVAQLLKVFVNAPPQKKRAELIYSYYMRLYYILHKI
jgi:hypothetical protein